MKKTEHQRWPDYHEQQNLKLQGRTNSRRRRRRARHQFQHSIQSTKEVRKNQFLPTLEENQQISYQDTKI